MTAPARLAQMRREVDGSLSNVVPDTSERRRVLAALDFLLAQWAEPEPREPVIPTGHFAVTHTVEPPDAWQPIATAPKDGTLVMLWWPFWCPSRPVIGSFGYKNIRQWVAAEALDGDGDEPTHWQPLPPAPETRGE